MATQTGRSRTTPNRPRVVTSGANADVFAPEMPTCTSTALKETR